MEGGCGFNGRLDIAEEKYGELDTAMETIQNKIYKKIFIYTALVSYRELSFLNFCIFWQN
jgi:hypothetical protein